MLGRRLRLRAALRAHDQRVKRAEVFYALEMRNNARWYTSQYVTSVNRIRGDSSLFDGAIGVIVLFIAALLASYVTRAFRKMVTK